VNAIALRQINNPEKEFSIIRMWGTIGWIVAGTLIGWMAWEPSGALMEAASSATATADDKARLVDAAGVLKNTFVTAAIASAVLGLFSFSLPNTPPPKAGQQVSVSEVLGLDAIKILKNKNYLVFFFASMLICIPLAFYYQEANKFLNETGMPRPAGKMIWGQIAETVFLFLMPWFFVRFNIKKMLLIGMAAWVLRYLLFGFGNADSGIWMLYLGIVLHGICYDFFFVTGQIYTDKIAGPRIRSAAQGLITLATYGVGMLIGFWVAGQITERYKVSDNMHDWKNIWMIPAGIAAAIAILFIILFRDRSAAKVNEP
jgi:nucleoside transporter